jgi:N-acetylglutamate synthase-like GNAT family acetyltransferase
VKLRRATEADAGWINAAYADVHFQLSDLSRDLLIVAELDGEHAGIGRLVPAGEAYELGGMLVFDAFRGRGVAKAIIDELLRHAGGREVYCIPFADLEPIYAKAGFVRRERDESLPAHVLEKLDWCEREMARAVILMALPPDPSLRSG